MKAGVRAITIITAIIRYLNTIITPECVLPLNPFQITEAYFPANPSIICEFLHP